jgi:hypothetical protein
MDSPPPPKRLHKSSSPSFGIWILLHPQKGFTKVHLQVLAYGLSSTLKRLHKSSSPSFGIWILVLHSPKASQEFISKFWDMDSRTALPKGFTRVHLQVLGYGFSYYTPQRLHKSSSPSFGIWILLLHSPKASQEFISKFWDMDSPTTLPKGFPRVHLQVLGYGFF